MRFLRLGSLFLCAASWAAAGCAASDQVEAPGTGTEGGQGIGGSSTSGPTTGSTGATSGGEGGSAQTTTSGTGGGSGSGGEGGDDGSGGSGSGGSGGGGDGCETGCPEGTWDVDGNALTGDCGCEYRCVQTSDDSDPIDADYTDDNCDGGDGLVEQCVYVSASEGSDSDAGTRQAPMKTIAAAIAKAQSNGAPAVCLSGELYEESVTVASGVSIYGGFDATNRDFKFRRSSAATTTVRAAGTVFNAPAINQETHIEGLTIDAMQGADPGESTYGVRLGGGVAQLFVRFNRITVADGRDGAPGANGQANAPQAPAANDGQPGCSGCTNSGDGGPQPVCEEFGGKGGDGGVNNSPGGMGFPGSGNASGGSPGGATQVCFSPSSSGGPGSDGSSGSQGSPGSGGANLGYVAFGAYVPAAGGNGQQGVNGKGGGGGGAGGGGSECVYVQGLCVPSCIADKGGGGGSGGCGGLGGAFGVGGQGGGASFGVLAAAGLVVVTNNDITTGKGGKGGKGGNGASGQLGSLGGQGGPGLDDGGSGEHGGKGGDGGAGGPGGGGGGGPSACVARSSSANATFSTNTCVVNTPGFGGDPGTNPDGGIATPGQTGSAGSMLQL